MKKQRILTGITTSGTPHLGNYVGAIRPAIQASLSASSQSFYFLADYHALIKTGGDAQRVARSRLEIAATWLAAGLNPDQVVFYRQSDIPEIPELCWMLTCITPKGVMNRAHAYKAACDANELAQQEADFGVNMGLYSYPILMAADILMFNAHLVPVGRDQIQHIEMTRDIAQRFNHMYGNEFFTLPEALIEESVAVLPGLDGRKMSKSYDNTIPLFEGSAKHLKTAIMRMVTDSKLPGEPKDPDHSHLYTIYRAFASDARAQAFHKALLEGMAWGDAKDALFELLEQELAPMREHYQSLIAEPQAIEKILRQGAERARELATPLMQDLRNAVGLRSFINANPQTLKNTKKTAKKARFISFKEQEGFQCRLVSAQGATLLLSRAYDTAKEVGLLISQMTQLDDLAEHLHVTETHVELLMSDEVVATGEGGDTLKAEIVSALAELRAE